MADLEHQRQIQRNSDKADAAAAGAFGNSRQGVVQANTNEAFDRTAASTLANLNSQGFDKANQLSLADIGNKLTAQQGNQNVGLSVAQQNSAQRQQANLDNAAGLANRQQFDAANRQQTNLSNAAGLAARQDLDANLSQQARQFNAASQQQGQQFNATNQQQMSLANLNAANTARSETAANDQAARMAQFSAEQARNTQDAANSLTAQQANQSTDLAGQQSNQQAGLTGNAQDLQASQLLAGYGQQRQQMGLNQVNALNSQGQINQDQKQSELDAAFKNATAQDQRATQALQIAGAPFSNLPGMSQGGTSTTSSSGKGLGI
jgi:hypothetical protein